MLLNAEHYKHMLDNLSEAVYGVDKERRILYWNRAAEQLTGYSAEEVVGLKCEQGPLQHVDEINVPLCEENCPLACCIATGKDQEKLVFALHKNGQRIPVLVKTSAIPSADGEILGAVEIFSDAAELLQTREMNKELLRQTHLDALTGVPNKQALWDALDREWFRFKRYNTPFSLLAIDIDYFRQLNDAYGCATGDAVLQWLVKQLRSSLRRADILGRVGGDKFMVLLSFSNRKSTLKVAHMVQEMVRNEPCLDLPMAMTVSIGAVTIEDGETLESVIERADKALARSKEMGRNQVTFWG
ncbi:MAG: sensor domain-containing diguanylate cyclase [Desulfuromonas sp.]|nr:sensor domain-containing diguanylate cyclase [Desulfuromonas sp.]